jgi:hypothetical protein
MFVGGCKAARSDFAVQFDAEPGLPGDFAGGDAGDLQVRLL